MLKFFSIGRKIRSLFGGKVDEEIIDSLEQLFFEADLGSSLANRLTEQSRKLLKANPKLSCEDLIEELKNDLRKSLKEKQLPPEISSTPYVILIEGVNGNGKTTSAAKLAHYYKTKGHRVLLVAADTFRAAAIDQLEHWAKKVDVEIVKGAPKSDSAAVVFDAIAAAKSRGCDIVIVDTAGRLHTKTDLMKELEKVVRVCGKALEGAPHDILLVLDATIGQNGVEQAKIFHQYTPLTGLILTKLDGTAKGGTAFAIHEQLKIPIKFIGTGEAIEDFNVFDPDEYINALF